MQRSIWAVFGLAVGLAACGTRQDSTTTEVDQVHGASDLVPIEMVRNTALYNYAKPIAHLESSSGVSLCTATRVGTDLFLTNSHCLEFGQCSQLLFHLGYERALAPADQPYFRCDSVLAQSLSLDYALFHVAYAGTGADNNNNGNSADDGDHPRPPPGGHHGHPGHQGPGDSDHPGHPGHPDQADHPGRQSEVAGLTVLGLTAADYPVAHLSQSMPVLGPQLMAAGHPAGVPKEISDTPKCVLTTVVPELINHRQSIRHMCDTDGGSSGTPLIDQKTGTVVALHWGGRSVFNMAIPMALIVQDLRHRLSPAELAELSLVP